MAVRTEALREVLLSVVWGVALLAAVAAKPVLMSLTFRVLHLWRWRRHDPAHAAQYASGRERAPLPASPRRDRRSRGGTNCVTRLLALLRRPPSPRRRHHARSESHVDTASAGDDGAAASSETAGAGGTRRTRDGYEHVDGARIARSDSEAAETEHKEQVEDEKADESDEWQMDETQPSSTTSSTAAAASARYPSHRRSNVRASAGTRAVQAQRAEHQRDRRQEQHHDQRCRHQARASRAGRQSESRTPSNSGTRRKRRALHGDDSDDGKSGHTAADGSREPPPANVHASHLHAGARLFRRTRAQTPWWTFLVPPASDRMPVVTLHSVRYSLLSQRVEEFTTQSSVMWAISLTRLLLDVSTVAIYSVETYVRSAIIGTWFYWPVGIFFAAHFAFRVFLLPHRGSFYTAHVLTINAICECLSIPSVLNTAAGNIGFINLNFLRAMTAFEPFLQLYNPDMLMPYPMYVGHVYRYIVSIGVKLAAVVFVLACIMFTIEAISGNDVFTLFISFYFMVVMLSTLAFGEFLPTNTVSRVYIIILIVVMVSYFAYSISDIIKIAKLTREGKGAFAALGARRHAIVCGEPTWPQVDETHHVMFSEQRNALTYMVLCVRERFFTDYEWNALLQRRHGASVRFLLGNVHEAFHRRRADFAHAESCLLFGDSLTAGNNADGYGTVSDAELVLYARVILAHYPRLALFVLFRAPYASRQLEELFTSRRLPGEMRNARSVQLGMQAKVLEYESRTLCTTELTAAIMANNLVCNGGATLIGNAIRIEHAAVRRDDRGWAIEYKLGMRNTLRHLCVPDKVAGLVTLGWVARRALLLYEATIVGALVVHNDGTWRMHFDPHHVLRCSSLLFVLSTKRNFDAFNDWMNNQHGCVRATGQDSGDDDERSSTSNVNIGMPDSGVGGADADTSSAAILDARVHKSPAEVGAPATNAEYSALGSGDGANGDGNNVDCAGARAVDGERDGAARGTLSHPLYGTYSESLGNRTDAGNATRSSCSTTTATAAATTTESLSSRAPQRGTSVEVQKLRQQMKQERQQQAALVSDTKRYREWPYAAQGRDSAACDGGSGSGDGTPSETHIHNAALAHGAPRGHDDTVAGARAEQGAQRSDSDDASRCATHQNGGASSGGEIVRDHMSTDILIAFSGAEMCTTLLEMFMRALRSHTVLVRDRATDDAAAAGSERRRVTWHQRRVKVRLLADAVSSRQHFDAIAAEYGPLYRIVGSPLRVQDLMRARVHYAHSVVLPNLDSGVNASPYTGQTGEGMEVFSMVNVDITLREFTSNVFVHSELSQLRTLNTVSTPTPRRYSIALGVPWDVSVPVEPLYVNDAHVTRQLMMRELIRAGHGQRLSAVEGAGGENHARDAGASCRARYASGEVSTRLLATSLLARQHDLPGLLILVKELLGVGTSRARSRELQQEEAEEQWKQHEQEGSEDEQEAVAAAAAAAANAEKSPARDGRKCEVPPCASSGEPSGPGGGGDDDDDDDDDDDNHDEKNEKNDDGNNDNTESKRWHRHQRRRQQHESPRAAHEAGREARQARQIHDDASRLSCSEVEKPHLYQVGVPPSCAGMQYTELAERVLDAGALPLGLYRSMTHTVRISVDHVQYLFVNRLVHEDDRRSDSGGSGNDDDDTDTRGDSATSASHESLSSFVRDMAQRNGCDPDTWLRDIYAEAHEPGLGGDGGDVNTDDADNDSGAAHSAKRSGTGAGVGGRAGALWRSVKSARARVSRCMPSAWGRSRRIPNRVINIGPAGNLLPYVVTNPPSYARVAAGDAVFVAVDDVSSFVARLFERCAAGDGGDGDSAV